tara:strand:+ start:23022 stop:25196 length:2175 start_codon:yes stop_codon:yes gene_type:complete
MLKKLLIIISISFLFSQEQSITNLTVGQLTDGSGLIAVNYDLIDNTGTFASFNVSVQVSIDDSEFQTYAGGDVSGDVGENVIPGTGKIIYIQAPSETYSTNVVVKVIATAYTVTSELPFTMISISSVEGVSSYQNESINYSYEIMQNEMTNAELVTFLETYDFQLNDDEEPIYNCGDYTEYFNTGINNNDNSIQCNDSSALNNGSNVDCVYDWQVGCTDSYAFNFNPEAMYYNCSCFYSGTSYSEHVPGITGGCNWGDIGYSDGGMNSFWYIDVNGDGAYDFMVEDGHRIVIGGCNDPGAYNYPEEFIQFFIDNNVNADCYDIQGDGMNGCLFECDEDYLGNYNDNSSDNYETVNIEHFSNQAISFEGSSFIIESGLGTQPAIFNYENCVDGVIVGLLLDYYGLRIPTGGEWVKAAREDNSRCWPWLESDCDNAAETYCNSIYTCMDDEEFEQCETQANDLFLECQLDCNDMGGGSNADCSASSEFDCLAAGCSWESTFNYCYDDCSSCMMQNGDLCGDNPSTPGCPCFDTCMGDSNMDSMMECMNECGNTYGNTFDYCNGQDVNDCNHCMQNSQDCEETQVYNITEFLDDSNYVDDNGVFVSDFDNYGFYRHVYSNKFYFYNDSNSGDNLATNIEVTDIAQFPEGISPFGLYDMIGNAPEIVKYNNNLWIVGTHPGAEYYGSFCANNGSMFDENDYNIHGTGLSISHGHYYNLYGLRLARTTQ